MKKNIVLLLLTVLVVQFCICSCTYYDVDPFLTDTDTQTGADTGVNTIIETETEANKNSPIIYLTYDRPDDDFYGLSVSEAYEKYGLMTFSRSENPEIVFDGKYTYYISQTNTNDPNSWTLYKRELPNGKVSSPVCTDPLCTHTVSSGCPLAQFKSNSFVCYGDKIFIVNSSDDLLMYDKTTNKSTRLLGNTCDGVLSTYNGKLYFYYNQFNQDFESERIIAKISEDGVVTEIKRFNDYYTPDLNIYGDRYVLDYRSETNDSGDGKVILYFRDIQTDEVKIITEIDCPDAVMFSSVQPTMFYGNKLLLLCRYNTKFPKGNISDERQAVWIIDLETKEKRLLCTPDYYTHKRFTVPLFSSKCVVWDEPRFAISDPIIMHVYFPYEDKELTYNFSDMIKAATGEDNLSLGIISVGNSRSAIVLFDNNLTIPDRVYEVDLENGNVYKYDAPAA